MTMIHNSEIVMRNQENSLNLITKLWHKLTTFPILNHKLLKYMVLTEIVIVQVFGSIENEHMFSMFNFMKNQLWNRLSVHLDLCTRSYNQHFFTL
jgi:hypothetical protein